MIISSSSLLDGGDGAGAGDGDQSSSDSHSQCSDETATVDDISAVPMLITPHTTTTSTTTTAMTATSMAKDFIGQSPFPFFDVCSRLITELALSS